MSEKLLLGRFRNLGLLGEGSTGKVYRVIDTSTDQTIALKILRPEITRRVGLQRFRRQFLLIAQLSHPAVLPVLDMGKDEGDVWLTSKLLQGDTLSNVKLPLTPEKTAKFILEIAYGLEFIHAHGIIHLDLKPSNIFISEEKPLL
ncbi:protein kinase, partial [bacterium]|nr:protein kinase [bacterium]